MPSRARLSASYDIFSKELLKVQHGYPMWQADPYGAGKIELGDVGYIRYGKFSLLFRLPLHAILPPNNQSPIERRIDVSQPFRSESVKQVSTDINGQATVLVKVGAYAGVTYACERSRGAILNCANRYAIAEDLQETAIEILRLYMKSNCKQWLIDHPGIPLEDILLVTGTVMTGDWEAAVWSSQSRALGGGVDVSPGDPLSVGIHHSRFSSWMHGVERSSGHHHPGDRVLCAAPDGRCYADGGAPEENQCIFVRGFWMRKRRLFQAPKVMRAAAEPEDDDYSDSSSNDIQVLSFGALDSDVAESDIGGEESVDLYYEVAEEISNRFTDENDPTIIHDNDVIRYISEHNTQVAPAPAPAPPPEPKSTPPRPSAHNELLAALAAEMELSNIVLADLPELARPTMRRVIFDSTPNRSGGASSAGSTRPSSGQNGTSLFDTTRQSENTSPSSMFSKDAMRRPTTPFTRSKSAYMRPPTRMMRPKSAMGRSKTPGQPGVIVRKERLSPWSASSDAGAASSNIAILKTGLPQPPQVFFGRDGELHQLILGILQGVDDRRGAHVAILGGASMGKSSLAIALLHHPEIQPHFSKHIYFVPCEGISTARDLVFCIASCLRIQLPASDPMKYLITFTDSLPGNKVIALDDFEGCWFSDDRSAVERVLQSISGIDSVTLVVSMRGTTPPAPSAVSWNVSVSLGVLPLPAAKEAFLSFAPNYRGNPRLDSLLERVDCMPIAVGLLGALARNGETIDGLQRRLLLERTLLMSVEPEHRTKNLEISFRITIDSKPMKDNPNALRLLSIICLLPAGVTRERLPILTGLHENDIGNAIYVLEMLALITLTGGTLTALAPLRDFIETNYPPHPNDEYMLEHYYTELTNFGEFEVGDARFTELREKLEPETVNLHYILSRLLQKEYGLEDTGRSILSFTQYLYWTAPASDLLETLLSRYSKYLSKLLRAQCLQLFGEVLHLQGKSVEAFDALEQARSGFEYVGDSYKTARCMHSIAKLHLVANNCSLARENAKKALEVFDNCRELKESAKCNCTLGEILYMEDEYAEALDALYLASDQFLESDDRNGAAQCHLLAGNVLRLAGEGKEAVEPLSHARQEFEILGYPLGEAQCYQSLGEILRLDCNTDEARVQFGKGMSIFKSQENNLGIAKCKMGFGHISFVLGELDVGENELRESLAIFKDIGYAHGEADASAALGNVLFGQERHEEAIIMYEKARDEFENFGNKSLAYDCTRNIGEIQLATDQAAEAIAPMLEAVEFYREVEDDAHIAECLRTLGNAFFDTEQFDKAIEALSESKDVFATLEETDEVAVTLGDLAAVYRDMGDYPSALELFGQCRAMYVELDVEERIDMCDKELKLVHEMMTAGDAEENAE